jgi:hypothetical protein
MTRLSFFAIFLLLGQLTACGPDASQKKPAATATHSPPDSSPADHTAVTGDTESVPPPLPPPIPASPGNTAFQISRSQVGAIKIGMAVSQLRQVVPAGQLREVAITKEGKGYKAYEIGRRPAGLLVEEICEPGCRVWRIQVKDAAYRTPEGLGIGSTLGEVKKHYPISFLGAGETEIVAVSGQQKITFMLDVSKLPPQNIPRLNLQNTPDSVKVLGMLVF